MTTTVIDLASLTAAQGFILSGVSTNASLGAAVSGIGDFNGDGIDDLLVSAPGTDLGSLADAGVSYVIFGKAGGMESFSISSLTAETSVILSGAQANGGFGISVAAAGDVNGDGQTDVIIGAPAVSFSGVTSGGAYVVLDTGAAASVGAGQLTGTAGFVISGVANGDNAGVSVDGIGDINGDGYDDVVIGAYSASRGSRQYAGEAYVVYGSATPTDVNLATLDAAHGFTLKGAAYGAYTGFSVSGAGDVNGDGKDDVIVGASSPFGGPGAAYVLYGGSDLSTVDLSSLTADRGFKISGGATGDGAGASVDSAGDLNGDGIDDLIVSAPYVDANGTDSGALYIIYGEAGTRANLNLADLTAAQGVRIAGASGETAGIVVRNVGDLDHDRIDDLFISSTGLDPNGRTNAGGGYVLYGGHIADGVNLAALDPTQGFMVIGAAAGDEVGGSVAGAGDLNNDGIDDLVLGSANADPGNVSGAGAAYVIYGESSGLLVTQVDAQTANGTYAPGDVITLALTFEGAVVVDTSGGTPRLKLETGATDRYATYVSGSGSDTLLFAYTVEGGDQTGDLDFAGSRALDLNGGDIVGVDGSAVHLTLMDPGAAGSLGASADIVISPSTPPVMTHLAGDAVTFTEDGPAVALDAGGDATLSTLLTDFAGARMVATIVSGAVADEDLLTLRADAHVGLQGASVTFDGATIGTVSGGTGGVPLEITFTAGATPGQAQAVLRALAYSNADTAAPGTGVRAIAVTVTDPFGSTSPAAFLTVSVAGQNDAPVLTPHTVFLSGVSENTAATVSFADLQKAATAVDPDGDPLAYKVMSIGSGTLLVDGVAAVPGVTVITAASKMTWTPQANASGQLDAFSIAAFDGTAVSQDWATVRAKVDDLNPDLTGPSAVTAQRNAAAGTIIATPALAGDTDGLSFKIVDVSVPTGAAGVDGTPVMALVDAGLAVSSSGEVYVQDAAKFAAISSSSLVVRLGVDDEDADTVLDDILSIQVTLKSGNSNEPPTGAPTASLAAGTEDTPYLLSTAALLAGFSDPEGGVLHVQNLSADHGTLADNGDGTFTLTPDPNFSGKLTLTYAVADAAGNRLESQMNSVTFTAENDAPVFSAPPANVAVAEQVTLHPLAGLGVTDADGAVTTVTLVFTAGYVSGQDVLSFANSAATGSIGGGFDPDTGTLTLTAYEPATTAEWQAALAAVSYVNISDTPDTSPRTLALSATDGSASSTVHSFQLSVTDTPDTIVELASLGAKGLTILGLAAEDVAGAAVSDAGDVNGDGYADILIGAPNRFGTASSDGGSAYLIYGSKTGFGTIDLTLFEDAESSNDPGIKISSSNPVDYLGWSVSKAGDVNDDGYADVLVGAPYANAAAGVAYLIYGAPTGLASFDISVFSDEDASNDPGIRISGVSGSLAGVSVSAAGDVNGDGVDDILVGATYAQEGPGSAYVIYGKTAEAGGLSAIDLSVFEDDDATNDPGIKITGAAGLAAGYSIAAIGDVNGDAIDDFVVGVPFVTGTNMWSGAAYVIYGKADGALSNISLATLDGAEGSTLGAKISGAQDFGFAGYAVSGLGDINGDGIDDFAVTSNMASFEGRPYAGAAYVIYGKDGGIGNISLADLTASQGATVRGPAAFSFAGVSVSDAGDVNGDGIADLIVGAHGTSPDGLYSAGAAFLVYGKAGGIGDIDLFALTADQGFRLVGGAVADQAGYAVSAAGDINGDGYDDVIVGAFGVDVTRSTPPSGDEVPADKAETAIAKKAVESGSSAVGAGAAYVVYGFANGPHVTSVGTTAESGGYAAGQTLTLTVTFDSAVLVDTTGGVPKLTLETGTVDRLATYVSGSGTTTLTFTYEIQAGDKTAALDVAGVDALSLDGATLTSADGSPVSLVLPAPGAEGSLSAAAKIMINAAPVLTLSGSSLSVEEGVAASLDSGLTLSDADDATLGSAKVQITDGYKKGEDQLSLSASSVWGDIQGTFNVDTGTLNLTSGSGKATLEQWRAALAAVSYTNLKNVPSEEVRTVTISVSDPLGAISQAQKSLTVTPVNDAPVFLASDLVKYGAQEGQAVSLDISNFANSAYDPDGDVVTYKIVAIPQGGLTIDGLAAKAGDAISLDSKLVWTPPANSTGNLPAFQIAAFDGAAQSTQINTVYVNVADVNPILTGPLSASVAENSPAGTVVARLEVSGDQDGLTFGFASTKTEVGPDGVAVVGTVGAGTNAGTVISPDGAFALDVKTGVITVQDASKLDFEKTASYTITVTVDDEDADTMADSTLTLTVDLTDVNEAPTIAATGKVLKITDLSRLPATDVATITGAKSEELGASVANAGDVNGDGIDDFIVGAPDTSSDQGAGAAYVIYGKTGGLSSFSVADMTASDGFKISGATAKDQAGLSVSSAGDLNGDGIDDLLIGAMNADKPANATAASAGPGAAYVVYGKAGGSGDIDLGDLSASDGFKIIPASATSRLGFAVASAGDINKDGIDDIIVGASTAGVTGTFSGGAYVIYGKTEGLGTIDLSKLTDSQGFALGGRPYDNVGYSVSGIGDVNGDGIDDFAVAAPGYDFQSPLGASYSMSNAGAAFVVYGNKDGLTTFNMSTGMGTKGFTIIGPAAVVNLGYSVSEAGDVNGDGIADLIVGGQKTEDGKGAAYVIYGKAGVHADVALASLTAETGFKIVGAAAGDQAGYSVSSAGDVNGDGIDDLLVGAIRTSPNGYYSGTTYVVFGTKGERGALDLATLTPDQGVALEGAGYYSYAGFSVSAAGDVNGDGIDDLIVGAPNTNEDNSGAAYIIYGKKDFAPSVPLEGTTVRLTYNDLLKVATVSDPDGDAVSFKLAALGSGVLLVDGVAAVAGETVITEASVVTWTPPANTLGTVEAFSVVAFDGALASDDPEPVPVRIAVTDVDPVLTGPSAVTLAENSPAGTVVAQLAVSGDQNGLTFGFDGGMSGETDGQVLSADGAFALDVKTGTITVHDASKLDFEAVSGFTLNVTVDDEDADTIADSSLSLAITLTDANDAPVLAGLPQTAVAAIAGTAGALPAFTFTDQDSTLFTVTLQAVNGTLGGLVDADTATAGLQLSGTAEQIQALLKGALFTPRVDGAAEVEISVSDGAGGLASDKVVFKVSTPSGTTVDVEGAVVTTVKETQADGSVKQTVSVSPEDVTTPTDIPLVQDATETLLSARIPAGIGLTAEGSTAPLGSAASLEELIAQIRLHTPEGSSDQVQLTEGGKGFLADLPADTALVVQTLVLTATAGADTNTPIVVRVPEGSAPTALVIDASALPPGTQIQFENVSFAAVVGPVTLGGGAGAQMVFADDAVQSIMLGADDDELHAGGGNDIVGSAGGDDRIFGEDGDDIVFGGPGRDLLHGGLGTDTARFDGNRADYEIVQDRGITVVRTLADATDVDVLVNVEHIAFADGTVDVALPESIGWISALYLKVLGRQGDLDGIQHYAALAERGVSAGDIALAIFNSPEAIAKGTGAAAGEVTVEQLYRTLFDREPDAEGLAYHKAQLDQGVTMAEVAAHFVHAPEMLEHVPSLDALDFSVGEVTAGIVTGTTGDDTLQGGVLDDLLISNGGTDVIDGRTGDDTVVVSGNRADYSIEEKDVHWTVKPIILPNLPHDGALLAALILKNVEHIQFDDMTVDLTHSSDLEWIGALYTQVLGRQGEESGLVAHLADYQAGASKGEIALSFMLSPEAVDVGHGAQDAAHLTADTVYQALLGRAPTDADHATYGELEMDLVALANALMGSLEMHGHYQTPTQQDFFI